jgi:TonB-dependent receptor
VNKEILKPARARVAAEPSFRLSAIAAAVAMAFAASAMAQTTPSDTKPAEPAKEGEKPAAKKEPEKLETLTVTGIRRGIEEAISVKKNSDSIIEAINAEDIGKLPDYSIAESIARLPGVSAQRVAGRAQVISVRGLSPDFATTLLNGREMVSTGDNRSVEFDQYPSELLNAVVIYKTPDASLVGQGLSGTIDMQTVRPLDFANRVIAVNARGTHNSLGSAANSDATGNRISASYIDQYNNRTFGLSLGFAHTETPVQENQVGLYEPWTVADRPGVPSGTAVTDGIKALRRTGENKRDGFMATLEWRPTKEWTSTFDMFITRAKQEDTANQWESHLYYNGNYPCDPACTWTGATVNDNHTLTGGRIVNIYPLVRGMYNKREDHIDAYAWKNDLRVGEGKVTVDLNYSKAKRDELSLENNTQLVPARQLDTATISFNSGDFSTITPARDYSNPNTLYLRNSIYGSGYGKVPKVKDELKGARINGNWPMFDAASGWFSTLEAGYNYADRTKEKHQPEANINVGAQGDTPIAADLQYSPVNLGFAGLGTIPAWNVPGAVDRYLTFDPSETAAGYLIAKAWKVFEKIHTVYAQGNLDTRWGGVNVRGNVGLQYQYVDQSSSANYFDNSAPAGSQVKPIDAGKTYGDWLPSMNLVFGLQDDQVVRFAIGKQVARPRVDQLRVSLDFGVDTSTGIPGASGGNPKLDPWRANAVDISYEKYFGTKAYVAAAAFYKDLKSYIYTQSKTYDFSAIIPGTPATTPYGQYTAPYNGQGGKLSGLELAASLPFDLMTPALKGFGIIASASFNHSDIKIMDPDSATSVGSGSISLPGLSDRVYAVTGYYENGGFEARISGRKRSDFIGEIENFNATRTLRYIVGETIADAQVAYTFKEGSLKGLGFVAQVNNLNNEPYQTYASSKDRPLEYIKWGRVYMAGVTYKF